MDALRAAAPALAEEVAHALGGAPALTLPALLRLGEGAAPVCLSHLGVLWLLDRCVRLQPVWALPRPPTAADSGRSLRPPRRSSHSGRVSPDDLAALLELCRERAREYQAFELEAQLQARPPAGSFPLAGAAPPPPPPPPPL